MRDSSDHKDSGTQTGPPDPESSEDGRGTAGSVHRQGGRHPRDQAEANVRRREWRLRGKSGRGGGSKKNGRWVEVSSKGENTGARKTRLTRRSREASSSKWSQTWGAGGSHPQATMDQECDKELRQIRRMIEFLVNRERKLDVKTDVAARRLERLERESSQLEDEEREAGLGGALTDRTKVVKLIVDKFVDKGYGFGRAPTGEVVFIHASVVQGAEVLVVGTEAWTQVVNDHVRAEGGYRARKAWGQSVEGGKGQRKGQPSGAASETSSSADGGTGSPIGEQSLRGMQPPSRTIC